MTSTVSSTPTKSPFSELLWMSPTDNLSTLICHRLSCLNGPTQKTLLLISFFFFIPAYLSFIFPQDQIYIDNITGIWWHKDINFIFDWKNNILWVRKMLVFSQENKFVSSSHLVIFYSLYRQAGWLHKQLWKRGKWCHQHPHHRGYGKYATQVLGVALYEFYKSCISK